MRTEDGAWGMAALWKANHPKCIVGIVDTVLLQDRKPHSWLFTAKTGEVLRKKTCSIADIVDRFTRISLANDRNVHRHVCVARKAHGSAFVWNAAKLGENMEATALDPHVVALQPFVCSRGGIGAIYRHDIKQPGSSRVVQSTAKLFQHEMSSHEPSIAVEPPREATKSNATTINSRLHAISMLVCRHLEEVQQIRIHHFVVDFIVDDDDQIWLAWIPQVDFEAKRSAPSISELISSDLSNNSPVAATLLASTSSSSSHLGFPTAFKCCGDFCRFELADDRRNTAMDKVDRDNNATRRRQIESLFPQAELEALGAAHLESLVQFAPVEDDRVSYTITYRSIALAKRNKEHCASDGQTRDRGSSLPAYMQSTISKEFRAGLNKLYGEVDGGTANYYRHVKVCPTCFAVYSMLDHSRETLAKQEEAKKLKTASSDSFHGSLPVIESPGRATPRPSSRDGQVIVDSIAGTTTLTPSTLTTMPPLQQPQQHVKGGNAKPWKAQATKTAEDFVGLDQYLRGHAKRRKQTILTRNALFPSSSNNKTSAKYAKQQPLPCSSSSRHASILIVDTDQEVINSIVAAFQAQYLIDSVCDGAVALKCAQENHYDAIVCGRDVPSLGAIELTKLLRQFEIHQSLPGTSGSRRRTPVLCLTSYTSPEDLRVYMEVGMDGCLALPLDMNALQDLLQTAVASSIETLPPPKPSMSLAKATAAATKKQPAVKKKKSSQKGATPATKSTDAASRQLGGVFQMDADTSMPFAVLNRPALQSINTFFNLVIVHDIFDTMERLEILLAPLLARYPGAQALLWNYPGQAFTTWRHGVLLNNVYLASCLDHLIDHGTFIALLAAFPSMFL
ncbi:hypothetical protein AC1031_011011 [Aphanomyces cochlioides]|nr:hypothetical protein AC1031_011011 [Aphanomyces cochlioides]